MQQYLQLYSYFTQSAWHKIFYKRVSAFSSIPKCLHFEKLSVVSFFLESLERVTAGRKTLFLAPYQFASLADFVLVLVLVLAARKHEPT